MGISAAFLVIFTSMVFSDTLCPEHRAWVMGLASVGLTSTIVAAVGLWRSWAIAAPLSVLAAGSGVAIGLIDSIHSVSRGRSIALAFAVLLVAAVALTWRQVVLLRWDRSVRRSLASSLGTVATPPIDEPRVRARGDDNDDGVLEATRVRADRQRTRT
jgi:hypothetical protein